MLSRIDKSFGDRVEAAVRTIVSVLSSQQSAVFDPINNILKQDPAIKEILSFSVTSGSNANVTFKASSTNVTDVTKGNYFVRIVEGALYLILRAK